jgi:hypothetical protein
MGNAKTTPASISVFAFLYLTIYPYLQFTKPHRAVIIAYFGFAPLRTTRKPSSAYTHQESDFSGSLATFEASGGRWLVDTSIRFRTRSSYECLISLLAFQSKLSLTMPRVMSVESLILVKQKEKRYESTDETTKDEKLQLSFLIGFAIFAIFKLRQLWLKCRELVFFFRCQYLLYSPIQSGKHIRFSLSSCSDPDGSHSNLKATVVHDPKVSLQPTTLYERYLPAQLTQHQPGCQSPWHVDLGAWSRASLSPSLCAHGHFLRYQRLYIAMVYRSENLR